MGGNMDIATLLDECLVDIESIKNRAAVGERGTHISRDIADVRRRLEDIEAEIAES